ncbi:MAG TPA: formate dehydrogenase accessory sulfurtransferase FdhD [Candidatus Sulfotelmatobacter sp.]|nr:formate dehydrogenase accessory sulfurtransferase FdhD [Candidatus Sulfotelmatobacter sp.]
MRPTIDPGHPLFGLGYAKPVELRTFERLHDGEASVESATVAEETPVALVYNGWPHVVMMCTPADVEDFAIGFTLTEEIVSDLDAITGLQVVRSSQGIEAQLVIPDQAAEALRGRGRSLVGRTGCGLCGVTTIDDALRPGRTVAADERIAPAALYRAGDELPAWQHYNEGTGAVHAAGWATREGAIVMAREDVGRHNALDKLVGAMVRAGVAPTDGFAVVTSRASYELVQKCAVAGIPLLAAISRPTGLAVRMADAAGITLAALLRGRSVNVYSHAERLTP